MLEVRCGTADKSHENSFFRYFASQVKEYFEKAGIDGVLVGMPSCLVMSNLQMDALLITDSSLTIIDFKDYANCDVILPDESDFERGRWETNKGFAVKGGSSPNPYGQLMLQRRRLKEVVERFCRHKIGEFDAGHISTMVCFSGSVTVSGNIPGWAKLKFFIADSDSFLQKLYDIANIRGVGLLESDFATNLFDRLFESQPYECDVKPSKPYIQEEVKEFDDEIADEGSSAIGRFLTSNSDILVVASVDPEERNKLALAAREAAHDARFSEAVILSPTKLAGDNLCSGIELDGSLYSEIYDFNSRYRDQEGVEHIKLARLLRGYSLRDEAAAFFDDDAVEPVCEADERIVFIVCESQLVSSSAWLDGSVVFGSGRLLFDILDYLSINADNKGRNKIIFIGDDCQLGSGSRNYSSMHAEAYPRGLSVDECTLPLKTTPETFVHRLAAGIRQSNFALLTANESDDGCRFCSPEEWRPLIEDVANNWNGHKIISYTNEQATQLNLYIKRSVLHSGENLSAGDVLVFNNQFNALTCNPLSDGFPTRTIRNGEFAVVTHVDDAAMQIPVVSRDEGDGESITFAAVRFKAGGSGDEYEAYVIREHLYASKAELSSAQETAIKVALSELERHAREQNPFAPGNPWFESMVSEGDYTRVEDEQGHVAYRQKRDGRRLTPQEQSYRLEILRKLESPGTPYFLLANAAKARFGWAVTAHKSQSYQWDTVTLSANAPKLGRHTEQYFRFLYTGASRAREDLFLVRWQDLTPFDEAAFFDQPRSNASSSSRRTVLRLDKGDTPSDAIASFLDGLQLEGVTFRHVGSSSYQERFEASRDAVSVVVAFSYNKRLEVGAPIRQKGDVGLFSAINEAAASAPSSTQVESAALVAYDFLATSLGDDAAVNVVRSSAYRDEIEISIGGNKCRVISHYNARGLISRLERTSGDLDVFRRVEAIVANKDAV